MTSPTKIAIILGSTRPNRNGEAVADWVVKQASSRPATYNLIDLRDHQLPLFDEPIPPAMGDYQNDHTKRWAETIAPYDGFVFVTPEYNHSTSGVLKNAIDYLNAEWANKACAFVSYGSMGGARAVEHLRLIMSELQVAHVRQQVMFTFVNDFENYSEFKPAPVHDDEAQTMFDQLESWAEALRAVRAKG
jgi:NAD(P)H-dependent FMN reductase